MNEKLHITGGSCPTPEEASLGITATMQHDIELLKSAILYGDEVTLCSPVSTALHAIHSTCKTMEDESFDKKLRALRELSRIVSLPEETLRTLETLSSIGTRRHPTPKEIIFKRGLERDFDKSWKEIRSSHFGLASGDVINQFLSAADVGFLKFQTLAEELITAPTSQVFSKFMELVQTAMTSESTYPLLDIPTTLLVSLDIQRGDLVAPIGARERSKQVRLMANLFERLPQFDLATLDEVVDIRKDLEKYLARFRSAMIKYSTAIAGAAWDASFPFESEQVFVRDVAPVLTDIEDQTRSNSYLSKLTIRYAQAPIKIAAPVLSLAIAELTGLSEILAIVFGVASLGANVADVFNQWKNDMRSISQNQLFFYYAAAKKLY